MAYQKENVVPLTKDEYNRLTEINFYLIMRKTAETVMTSQELLRYADTMAMALNLPSQIIQETVHNVFADTSLPPSREELVEIMYRTDLPRRTIKKRCHIRDDKITEIINAETSYIKPCSLDDTTIQYISRFIDYFITVYDIIY